jgi:PAS domain S-box-containing protein
MNSLSMLALVATMVYLGLCAMVLVRDPRAGLNRVFATLCLAYAIWCFGFMFMYSGNSREECWGWDRVASLGWAFFPALALHSCLLLGRRDRWLARPWAFVLLYLPGLVMFTRYQLFDLGTDIDYLRLPLGWTPVMDNILPWFVYFECYLALFLLTALWVLVRWARTAVLVSERRQAWALVTTCVLAFGLGFLIDSFAEDVVGTRLPPMAPMLGVIWAGGIAYSMTRHRLMVLSPASASGQILESVRDLLLLVDRDERIVDASPQALVALGFERGELVGGGLGRILGGEDNARKALQSTRDADMGAFPLELSWVRKDGRELPVWLWGSPIVDRDGDWIGAVLVGRDLSEQRRVEDELVRACGVESIGLLAGGIAHDFNNLMTAVIGNLELAREASTGNATVRDRLDEAGQAADQARQLAQRLLSFYRGRVPDRREVDLGRVVKEASSVALRGSRAQLQIRVAPGLRMVLADEAQLVQVLHNLLINGRQAMPEGGTISIEVSNCGDTSRSPEGCPGLPAGEYVCLSVRDEGPGIPPEVLSRIFEPFFTTKETGTGLGLPSSRSIVRRHGGDIVVVPGSGRGCTFRVFLPAA